MKILVTGGCGFIGSNFIHRCFDLKNNFEIINLDAMYTGSNNLNFKRPNKKEYKFVKGDICNSNLIKKLIKEVDIVINFAAESHVDRSIVDSKKFLHSNVLGVHSILEALRKNDNTKFLQISTDEVYGECLKGDFKESRQLNPSNPYASTKAAAEMLINSYKRTYDLDIVITRCANNFGPRQFPEKLIPRTILSALKNEPIPIHGNGLARRQWIHVFDHCDAILKIISNWKSSSIYNISSNVEKPNIEVVKIILNKMKKSTDLLNFVKDRPGQDKRYSINSEKIKKELNVKSSIAFNKGIEDTISWYLQNKNWSKKIILKNIKSTPWLK
jgi:dTDP-glucose 4,6-dehydratase